MEKFLKDLRYGARLLLKSPGFTAVAVLSLALGIGANTALFSLVDKTLIRPLPVEEPERLVTLGVAFTSSVGTSFTYPDFADYRDSNEVFEGLVCYTSRPLSLSENGQSELIQGLIVSGNYFSALAVNPALGRGFLPEEDKTPDTHPVIVLSHGLWQRRFGADPAIIGKTIKLNEYGFTVVGIAPAEFTGTIRGYVPDVYVPIMMQAQAMPGRFSEALFGKFSRNFYWLSVLGRLKPGVSREQARAAMDTLGGQIARANPNSNGSPRSEPKFVLEDGSQGHTYMLRNITLPLKMLMAIVGLILLIACANVANLLLARASARHKEIAIRLAVGAGRAQLIRQLLTESVMLAMIGGGIGLLLAGVISDLLLTFAPPNNRTPLSLDGGLDLRVLGFTLLLSLLTGIIFGLAPAIIASRTDLVAALKDETAASRGRRRLSLRNILVVAQVALSLVVLIGAGLCIRSLQKLQSIDAGFEPAKVLIMSLNLGLSGYDEERGLLFYPEMIERIKALPGVESVSLANAVPLSGGSSMRTTTVEGYEPQPDENMNFYFNVVAPDYFQTMGIPFVAGREFIPQDAKGAPDVVIINETLARRYWPAGDALGKRLIFESSGGRPSRQLEIVGVVKDSKYRNLTEQVERTMFLPLSQNYSADMTLHIRTAVNPENVVAGARSELNSLDANLPVYNIRTLEEQKSRSLYTERMAATLLSIFGIVALLLAAAGIYGVAAYAVNRRTREIGVRMALGARPSHVLKLVMVEGMAFVVVGLALGLTGAFAVTRLLTSFLYNVSATDTATFAVIASLLTGVALSANFIPARRAAKVDPMVALRYE